MLISLILLILMTIFGRDKEDYKWFVFHSAIFNLILGILLEIVNLYNLYISTLYIIIDYAIYLAVNSIFPLAFSRFFFLYFPHCYEKIFTKRYIFVWILCYDLIIWGIIFFQNDNTNNIYNLIISFFLLSCTIFCSILIVIKIRRMKKLVQNNPNLQSYRDLNRAAFICIFQALIISLHLLNSVYCLIFLNYIQYDKYLFDSFFVGYIVLNPLQYPLYYTFVIIDSVMTMVVLKSYRAIFVRIYRKVVGILKGTIAGKSFIHVQPSMIQVTSVYNTRARGSVARPDQPERRRTVHF